MRGCFGYVAAAIVLLFIAASPVEAQCPRCGKYHNPVARAAGTVVGTTVGYAENAAAAAKAASMAARGRLSHRGQLAGDFEGVGRGPTPAAAIAAACRPGLGYARSTVSVRKGKGNQYYAVVGYSRTR